MYEGQPGGLGDGTSVLVVDDEPFICDFLRRCLDAEGYDCAVAHDAGEAWEMLEERPVPLVLSDINMPGTDGIELLRRVRHRHADEVAMIMVTAVDDKEMAIRALELGAYSYLIKPFEPNEAIIHAANALERRRLTLASNQFQDRLRDEVRQAEEEIGWRLLAAVGWRDEETGAHIYRVGRGAQAIARELGWDEHRLDLVELAAAMHDIGKIAVPDAVLLKAGPLSPEEFEQVRRHTVIGASMLGGSSNAMLQLAEEIARAHHERWDGNGYPDGLAGEEIPESARIVAVIDAYDALTSDRPYRAAHSEEEALERMERDRGSHFDPRVFDAFLQALPEIRRIDRDLRRVDDPSLRFPGTRMRPGARRGPARSPAVPGSLRTGTED